jgi:hypothetical protein
VRAALEVARKIPPPGRNNIDLKNHLEVNVILARRRGRKFNPLVRVIIGLLREHEAECVAAWGEGWRQRLREICGGGL